MRVGEAEGFEPREEGFDFCGRAGGETAEGVLDFGGWDWG